MNRSALPIRLWARAASSGHAPASLADKTIAPNMTDTEPKEKHYYSKTHLSPREQHDLFLGIPKAEPGMLCLINSNLYHDISNIILFSLSLSLLECI